MAEELGRIEFLAQNIKTADFNEPGVQALGAAQMNGVPVAVIGAGVSYTPIANPRHFVADWTFGIQERELQTVVDEARAKGAKAVVLLSHNGADVDLKLAGRVSGIDAILGGHTHDGMPLPVVVGKTIVTNAGSNGKFLGVLTCTVDKGGVRGYRYRLLPVLANLLPADADMAALGSRSCGRPDGRCTASRACRDRGPALPPQAAVLATAKAWTGPFLDALMAVKGTEDRVRRRDSAGAPRAASRAADPARATRWIQARDHLSAGHGERDDGRHAQGGARRYAVRQPVPTPILYLQQGGRHGARGAA